MKQLQNKRGKQDPDKADIREMLKPLMQALTDPDEEKRQDNVRRLLSVPSPTAVRLVMDRLVELLASRKESIRRQAGASLNQIGSAALPALTLALVKSRRPGVQLAAVETLTAIAPRLQQDQRLDLMKDAMIAGCLAADASARTALAALLATVRETLEPAPCPGAVSTGLPDQVGDDRA